MAEIPEIVSEPPIIDRLVLHIWPWPTRPALPPSAPSQCPSTTPVIPMRAMTEIRDVVFFVAVILATQLRLELNTATRGRERGGEVEER